jgi:DNA-binding PucR family transcriptional regulator
MDVALLASALQDDVLLASLRHQYLEPFSCERDGGIATKETLRAYFGAARNISSTAAALGISRTTVASRLAAVEERLDRSLDAVAAELDVALRLDQFERTASLQ